MSGKISIVNDIKEESKKWNIPIVRDNTITFIKDLINEHKFQTMLEVGGGIGYSSCVFADLTKLSQIISIEKNKERFLMMKKNLSRIKAISIVNYDAFKYEPKQKFDFIFIDGPKSHQEDLVKKYLSYLNNDGIMVIDNIFLKKITSIVNPTKNQTNLIEKAHQFKRWLLDSSIMNVQIIDIDDGIALIKHINHVLNN